MNFSAKFRDPNSVKSTAKTDSAHGKLQLGSIERNRAEQNINKGTQKQFSSNSKASTSETNEQEKLWNMLLTQNVAKKDVNDDQPNAVVATFMKNVISKENAAPSKSNVSNDLMPQKIAENTKTIEQHNVTSSTDNNMSKTPNDGIKFIEAISKSMKISNNSDKSTIDGTVMWMETNESGNSDSDGCTDTLKKWLRISDDKSTDSSTKSQTDNAQTSSINVQDMFKVDTYTLPKPPQTWRTASVDQNVHNIKQNVYKNSNEQIVNKSGSRLFYASSNHPQQYNGSVQQNMQTMSQSQQQNFIYHPQPQPMQHRYPVPPPMFNRPTMPSNPNFHHHQPPNFFYNKVSHFCSVNSKQ